MAESEPGAKIEAEKKPGASIDMSKLRPASENPWYRLMTLYEHDDGSLDIDANRNTWNKLVFIYLDAVNKAKIAKEHYKESYIGGIIGDSFVIDVQKAYYKKYNDQIEFNNILYIEFDSIIFDLEINFINYIFYKIKFTNSEICSISFVNSIVFCELEIKNCIMNSESKISLCNIEIGLAIENNTLFDSFYIVKSNLSIGSSFTQNDVREFLYLWDVNFKGRTRFLGTTFFKSPPDFRGSTMHEATELEEVVWPPVPTDREQAYHHIHCYERLKQEAEKLKKHHDELMFFALEMRCREVVAPWHQKIAYFLYRTLSDYGRSFLRPLAGLSATWLLGWVLVLQELEFDRCGTVEKLTSCLHQGWAWSDAAQRAGGLSFANTFWPLGLRKELYEEVLKAMSGWLHLLSIFQGAAGLLFLFLLGLALRNQFRMK